MAKHKYTVRSHLSRATSKDVIQQRNSNRKESPHETISIDNLKKHRHIYANWVVFTLMGILLKSRWIRAAFIRVALLKLRSNNEHIAFLLTSQACLKITQLRPSSVLTFKDLLHFFCICTDRKNRNKQSSYTSILYVYDGYKKIGNVNSNYANSIL